MSFDIDLAGNWKISIKNDSEPQHAENTDFFKNNKTDLTTVFFTNSNDDNEQNKFDFSITGPDTTDNILFDASVLIVGGGGGGGYNIGGGGGGGEVIYIDGITFMPGIDYTISVGNGGNGSRENYYSGDSGYNSSLNNIIAKGGGGGASYLYDRVDNLKNIAGKVITYASSSEYGKGLNGGSGGGGCGLQYPPATDGSDLPEYNYGDTILNDETAYKSPIADYDNYYNFGNKGGIGNKHNIDEFSNLMVRGSGGGGAGMKGENSETETERGHGGDGIKVESINLNGNKGFCSLISSQQTSVNDCIIETHTDSITNKNYDKMTQKFLQQGTYNYWGGGGGAGSYNIQPGNGGKGGGGGGGRYEDRDSSISDQSEEIGGNIAENTYIYFENPSQPNSKGKGYVFSGDSSEPPSEPPSDYTLAEGGHGIRHTGGGGGGGGLDSHGGKGGSGIVVIIIKNTPRNAPEIPDILTNIEDIEQIFIDFKYNKKELGKNLSKLYANNFKEHKNFYDFIDRLYEDDLLIRDKPHEELKPNADDLDNQLLKYSYDRDIYDIKFHLYLKIIYDLKINYDSFLFFSKKRDSTTNQHYYFNTKIFNHQILLFIINDILEDILIFIRNEDNYYDILKNINQLKITLKNSTRDTYEFKDNIKHINKRLKDVEKSLESYEKERESIVNMSRKGIKIGDKLSNIDNKINTARGKIDSITSEKNDKLSNDKYYTYDKDNNTLELFISTNNSFSYNDDIIQGETKNLLNSTNFVTYKLETIEIKNIINNESIKSLIKNENDKGDLNEMNLLIKIYLYSILNIKKDNFINNTLSLYSFISITIILQDFYKKSEQLLLDGLLIDMDPDLTLSSLCTNKLYDSINNVIKYVRRMKSLMGYYYMGEYIDGFEIINPDIEELCPKVNIKFTSTDSNKFITIFKRFNNCDDGESDELIICTDTEADTETDTEADTDKVDPKYKIDYKNLIESFLVEIDGEKYNITDFKFKKITGSNEYKVTLSIDDRYSKICKEDKQNNQGNQGNQDKKIFIKAKDSVYINDVYDNDVEILDKYNENIKGQIKNLEDINEKYSRYKYNYDKLKLKNNIYYVIIFFAILFIVVSSIINIDSYSKSLSYMIIISILIILVIYNYFTQENINLVEKFTSLKNKDEIFYDYYTILPEDISTTDKTIITISDTDKLKLRIRKYKNTDSPDSIKALIMKDMRIYFNKSPYQIADLEIDTDPYYYKINNITIDDNLIIEVGESVVLVKNDENIIYKLLNNIDLYRTLNGTDLETICGNIAIADGADWESDDTKNIKMKRTLIVSTIRNDLLKYINNKFINIEKIIYSINLERANNLSNKVHKSLSKEKKNLQEYQKNYEKKTIKNMNVNNLYKHEILFQTTFINFILYLSIIIIFLLLLFNMFPSKIILILILGFILIVICIYDYVLNSAYATRKDASKKYW
jgi:hypothetical protein